MHSPRPATRFVALDGVRGIAALAVVLYHYSEFSSGTTWLPRAWLAVDVFVCLSGFVIAHNYQRRIEAGMSLREFARRRLARLYPVYLFGLILGVLVFVAAPVAPAAMSAAQFAIAAALGALVLPYPNELTIAQGSSGHVVGALFPFDGPAWSMFFELAVNAAFFVVVARRWTRLAPMLAISAVLYLGVAYASTGLNAGWSLDTFAAGFPRVAFAFFAGVALYGARVRREGEAGRSDTAARWAVPAILLMVVVFALPAELPGGPWVSALGALALGPLIVRTHAAVQPGPRLAALCHRLGWLSYPLYIVHVPLLGGLALLDPPGGLAAPAWVVIGAKAGVAVALAWCVAWLDDVRRRQRRRIASAGAR